MGPGAGSSLIERQSRRFIKGRSADCPVPKSKQDCLRELCKKEYLLLTQQKTSGSTFNMFYLCTTILSLKNSKYLPLVIKKQLTELRQNDFIIAYSFTT